MEHCMVRYSSKAHFHGMRGIQLSIAELAYINWFNVIDVQFPEHQVEMDLLSNYSIDCDWFPALVDAVHGLHTLLETYADKRQSLRQITHIGCTRYAHKPV